MIPTLPLGPRDRLAELVLTARHDAEARRELQDLAGGARDAAAWLGQSALVASDAWVARLRLRARQALEAIDAMPAPAGAGLPGALEAAAALFDAGLGFEVHEVLEPHWTAATGGEREALQGLIQVAVGYQHLANDNAAGARALLAEGAARLERGRLEGYPIEAFGAAVRAAIPSLPAACPPPFPRRA